MEEEIGGAWPARVTGGGSRRIRGAHARAVERGGVLSLAICTPKLQKKSGDFSAKSKGRLELEGRILFFGGKQNSIPIVFFEFFIY